MKNWEIKKSDRETASAIMSACGVSSLTASVLSARGYKSPEEAVGNLECNALSDPFLIKDMDRAVKAIEEAVQEQKKICIYGDYDCDGIMSSFILYSYLSEAVGADVEYYIPERSEGYGLNTGAVDKLKERGIEFIITVDNGITAVKEAEYIYSLGMKLVITDHHQQLDVLPKAEAVVDPHRHDCGSPYKFSCGAVVALKLVCAMEGGDYTLVLEQFGDLACIATVADVVSITGENKFIVSNGLKLIENSDRPAIVALKEVSGLTGKKIDSSSVGFRIGPRINASGRLGSAMTAMKLLTCQTVEEAMEYANEMELLNTERKNMENAIVKEIYKMADEDPEIVRGRVIFVCGKGWHHGIIGIVASRIVEKFGKPCFIASEENGEVRGSARSFGSFSVAHCLKYCADTLEKFGGHAGAGGFTIKQGMTEDFHKMLEKYALENHRIMPFMSLCADTSVSPAELNVRTISDLDVLKPFGVDNEEPLFAVQGAEVLEIIPLQAGNHTKLKVKFGDVYATALAFGVSPEEIPVKRGDRCDMIVRLELNELRGNVSVSVYISDIRPQGFRQDKYFAGLISFEAFMRGEELPENYYPAMLPSREDAMAVYRNIPKHGICVDSLYIMLASERMNYCRFSVIIETFRQLGLVEMSGGLSFIKKIETSGKSDLFSAPVLRSLVEKTEKTEK